MLTLYIISVFLYLFGSFADKFITHLSFGDKRKRPLGFRVKNIQRLFNGFSMLLLMIGTLVGIKHEFTKAEEQANQYRLVDSTSNYHFTTTLDSIKQSLIIQRKSLDSTRKVLIRQTQELENQQQSLFLNNKIIESQSVQLDKIVRVLKESDPLYESTLFLTWHIEENPEFYSHIARPFVDNYDFRNCLSDYDNNGVFFLKNECIEESKKVIKSISIYFIPKELSELEIVKLFNRDTLPFNNQNNDYDPLGFNEYFPSLKPIAALRTKPIKANRQLSFDSNKESVRGTYLDENIRFSSSSNSMTTFSDLYNCKALLIINSLWKNTQISNIDLSNTNKDKSIYFSKIKLLNTRTCDVPYRELFYQSVYLTDIDY